MNKLLFAVGVLGAAILVIAATPYRVPNESIVDTDTGLIYHVDYDEGVPGVYTIDTPLKQAAVLMDLEDEMGDISDGALTVRDVAEGFPTLTSDATGQDAYSALVALPSNRTYTHLTVTCETKAAILSFNGSTSHIYCPVGTITIDGLRVVGGSNIYAKNRTAGENYANLYVNIW